MLGIGSKLNYSAVMLMMILMVVNKPFLINTSLSKSASWEISLINDKMSILFATAVLTISMMIYYYSKSYMSQEVMKKRFTMLMMLFVLSMLILIYSPNLMFLMVGWDGLGLTSFCLVIFYQNYSALKSGLITIITNRLGDCMMIVAISISAMSMIYKVSEMNKMLAVMVIGASFTKSAQTPFSAWLPAAMAAPTPVSSLVHSSTLVTAGVYMMSRFNLVLDFKLTSFILLTSSTMTSVMAGLSAWKETDSKKVVAMSTLSQLGLMGFALSMKLWKVCLMHMTTHALFKALLFMVTGYNMNLVMGSQESRVSSAPKTKAMAMLTLANLSLMGVPFLTGFYSKDLMLEAMTSKEIPMIMGLGFMVSCIMTSIYTFIIINTLSTSKKEMPKEKESKSDKDINNPALFISILVILMGPVISEAMPTQLSKPLAVTKLLGSLFIAAALIMIGTNSSKKNNYHSKLKMMMLADLSAPVLSSQNVAVIEQSKLTYNSVKKLSSENLVIASLVLSGLMVKLNNKSTLKLLALPVIIIISAVAAKLL